MFAQQWSKQVALFLFIQWNPFTPAVLHQRDAVLIPHDHAVERVDQRGTGARNLIIDRSFAQPPGGVDAPVGAADGALVMQIEAGSDLFVGHALGYQLGAEFAVVFVVILN